MPALTGEFLFPCFVEPEETGSRLPDLVRSAAARSCKARFYCFDALACNSGGMLHDSATWGDLGRPQALQVVRKPEARRLAADLINAIEASDVGGVRRILAEGQDGQPSDRAQPVHETAQDHVHAADGSTDNPACACAGLKPRRVMKGKTGWKIEALFATYDRFNNAHLTPDLRNISTNEFKLLEICQQL